MQTPTAAQAPADSKEKLMVFGGTGYIGSAVCKTAVDHGYDVRFFEQVTVVTRKTPAVESRQPWQSDLRYIEADVNDAAQDSRWATELPAHKGVVSCVGAFAASQKEMARINGSVNERIVDAVAATPATRLTFVSAHAFILPGLLLSGYYEGKHRVEEAIRTRLPDRGVALRPSMVYGKRGSFDLGLMGRPLAALANVLPHGETAQKIPLYDIICVPPVSLKNVANAAVVTAMKPADTRVPSAGASPFIDVWRIQDAFSNF